MATHKQLALLLLSLVLTSGCSNSLYRTQPDLGDVYNRSARYHGADRNPVIVIPGLTGSRLVDEDSGRVVWGAFAGDFAKPNRPEDTRLIALPLREGVPLRDLHDTVRPDGVLDRIRIKLLGLPIELQAYFEILASLGAGGYRDESLGETGQIDYGDDHYTCFQFDFDWRRDNVESAQRLHEFIQEKAAYIQDETRRRFGEERRDLKFDIVAHSMGGLLLRYYLRYGNADLPADGSLPELTWAGAEQVERVVIVGTPNAGTLDSVRQLTSGRDYGPVVSTYPAAVLGTYPSAYQMLPRSRHQPLEWPPGATPSSKDLFDPELWRELRWGLMDPDQAEVLSWLLPDVDPESRQRIAYDHLSKSLTRARHFTAALDRPATPPPGLEYFLIAADSVPTPRTATLDPKTNRYRVVERGPGDGTVLRSSALMDERMSGDWQPRLVSPIGWHQVMFLFQKHMGLTKDPLFTDNVLFWLLEDPR